MAWNDSNFDIGQKSSGMSGNKFMPKITKDGVTTGPSERRPMSRKPPSSGNSFSHQMSVPPLPMSHDIQGPRKIGGAPNLFPQGSVRTGLNAIEKVPSVTTR